MTPTAPTCLPRRCGPALRVLSCAALLCAWSAPSRAHTHATATTAAGVATTPALAAAPPAVRLAQAGHVDRRTPIAVLPFDDLTGNPELSWIAKGVPETLHTDLEQAGFNVTERAQLKRVLDDLALKDMMGLDTDAAETLGELAGAKVLVLGAVQKAGYKIRLTARFVNASSGAVLGAVKATGELGEVFQLQDQVATALVGKARAPKQHARLKPASISAFKLFAEVVDIEDQSERQQKLAEAAKLDPHFVYAVDALADLRAELAALDAAAKDAVGAKVAQLRAAFSDLKKPAAERAAAAQQLLTTLQSGRRLYTLVALAEPIMTADLPTLPGGLDVGDMASGMRVMALVQLKQHALALDAARKHMRTYPAGMYAQSVRLQIDTLIAALRDAKTAGQKARQALGQIKKEEATLGQKPESTQAVLRPVYAQRRCSEPFAAKAYALATLHCKRALKALPAAHEMRGNVYYMLLQAYAEQGKFEKAKSVVRAWEKEAPDAPMLTTARTLEQLYPTDTPTPGVQP